MFVEITPDAAREIATLLRGSTRPGSHRAYVLATILDDGANAVEPLSPYPILDEIAQQWAKAEGLDLNVQDDTGIWGAMQEIASRWEDVSNPENGMYQDRNFVEGITRRLLDRIEEALHG